MSEDAPTSDESQRIEDTEKAQVGDDAGAPIRSAADNLRNEAAEMESEQGSTLSSRELQTTAIFKDNAAKRKEELAGRQYDTAHGSEESLSLEPKEESDMVESYERKSPPPADDTFPMADKVAPLEEVEHVQDWNAPKGDPEYVEEDSPTTEKSPKRGLTMAGEEDRYGHRTEAVKYRRANRELEHFGPTHRKAVREYADAKERRPFLPFGRRWDRYQEGVSEAGDKVQNLREQMREILEEATGDRSFANRAVKEADAYSQLYHYQNLEKLVHGAREADQTAKKRGELAGILHDHPPSRAYFESHPLDIDYDSVDGLLELESEVPRLVKAVEEVRSSADELKDYVEEKGPLELETVLGIIEDLKASNPHDFYSEAAQDIVDGVLSQIESIDDSTTIGQLKDIALQTVLKTANATEAELNYCRTILDDVKSGRAGHPPQPTETDQAAA